MEEVTLTMAQMIVAYGPLGVIAVYFAVKDYKATKEMKNALKEFTICMKTFEKVLEARL